MVRNFQAIIYFPIFFTIVSKLHLSKFSICVRKFYSYKKGKTERHKLLSPRDMLANMPASTRDILIMIWRPYPPNNGAACLSVSIGNQTACTVYWCSLVGWCVPLSFKKNLTQETHY